MPIFPGDFAAIARAFFEPRVIDRDNGRDAGKMPRIEKREKCAGNYRRSISSASEQLSRQRTEISLTGTDSGKERTRRPKNIFSFEVKGIKGNYNLKNQLL